MVKKIRLYGDRTLRKESKPITHFSADIKKKATDLIETLEHKNEFALSAPQIGYNLRMFVIRTIWEKDTKNIKTILFINPELLEFEGIQNLPEGCLSIPEVFEKVKRAEKVIFKAQNIDGKWKKYTAFELFARGVQHEYDHLDGILFIDKINPFKRKLLQGKLKKLASTTNNGVNIV